MIETAPIVFAIVVTYNRKQLLIQCLSALAKQTQPLSKIIIVDNASTDGTLQELHHSGLLENPLEKNEINFYKNVVIDNKLLKF